MDESLHNEISGYSKEGLLQGEACRCNIPDWSSSRVQDFRQSMPDIKTVGYAAHSNLKQWDSEAAGVIDKASMWIREWRDINNNKEQNLLLFSH